MKENRYFLSTYTWSVRNLMQLEGDLYMRGRTYVLQSFDQGVIRNNRAFVMNLEDSILLALCERGILSELQCQQAMSDLKKSCRRHNPLAEKEEIS